MNQPFPQPSARKHSRPSWAAVLMTAALATIVAAVGVGIFALDSAVMEISRQARIFLAGILTTLGIGIILIVLLDILGITDLFIKRGY